MCSLGRKLLKNNKKNEEKENLPGVEPSERIPAWVLNRSVFEVTFELIVNR